MASSKHPANREDDIDSDVNVLEEEEDVQSLQTPSSGNRGKRKETQGANASKSTKKTRSIVWEHFTRMKDEYDKCNCHYYGKVMACATTSGTSNLTKHLRSYKQYKVWEASKAEAQHVLTPEGAGGSLRLGKISEDVFRDASNEMLVLGELPLAFIESFAWRHFCDRVKLYKPHSRRTATKDIVKMYVQRKAAMKKILEQNKERLSLTTDIWVAPTTGASYMVVTAHFIDSNWQLKKLIIGFKNICDHKGATICDVLLECLEEWDIKKIFTITMDNATANSSAMRRFKDAFRLVGDDSLVLNGDNLHLRCATHILNLIVKDGLHEIDKNICVVRNGVHYVRSSTSRLKSFQLRVDTVKMTRGSLPLDCKTRWNSTYLMLNRALQFRLAFEKMEAKDKLYNDHFLENVEGKKRIRPPCKADWDAVDRLVRFLIIFYNSTLILSASTSVNSYKCYNEIVTIERNIQDLSISPDEELKKKAASMIAKLNKYWDPFGETNKLLIVASVFNPMNKTKFAQLCFEKLYGKDSVEVTRLYDAVMDILKHLFEEYTSFQSKYGSGTGESLSSSRSQGTSYQSQDQVQGPGEVFDRMALSGVVYERMDSVYKEHINETGFQDASTELEIYLKEPVVNPNLIFGSEFDVLSWWKVNSPKFPVLSQIAKDILAMQVSSVASECAFSTSGRILDPYRSCLTHYMLEVLMCTEQWLKSEIRVHDKGATTVQQLLADVEMQDDLEKEFEGEN